VARILLIDDSVSTLELVECILSQAGHEVITSQSGVRGAAIVAREPLDLLITDIYMPEKDGLEVLRGARRSCPGLRVIAMSAVTGKHDMLRVAKALGARLTLRKPFSTAQLLEAVNACLAPQGAKDA
jgi:DNA-binding response OmpR family regulator